MNLWSKTEYDTLTVHPNRDANYYLDRHRRRKGMLQGDGGGRLARFGKIAKYKPMTMNDIIEGRIDPIYVAEYQHYVWHIRPHCVYCGVELTRSTLTRDHVTPRCNGGEGGDNLVPACGPCNREKGSHSLLHFLIQRSQKHRVINMVCTEKRV